MANLIFAFGRNTATLLLLITVPFTTAFAQGPVLDDETMAEWREHILPSGDDLAWQAIPWHTTFAEGIQRANEADRPLLLWVMNGHPFGCT